MFCIDDFSITDRREKNLYFLEQIFIHDIISIS